MIIPEDRDVAKFFNDLLDCWIKGVRYILRKEALGPELAEMQREFFEKSCEMEDLML